MCLEGVAGACDPQVPGMCIDTGEVPKREPLEVDRNSNDLTGTKQRSVHSRRDTGRDDTEAKAVTEDSDEPELARVLHLAKPGTESSESSTLGDKAT